MTTPTTPPNQPAQPAAPAAGAPAPAPAPAPVQYVAPTAMAQVTVDGRKMDVPVADLVKKYQIGTAAEVRLQQANQLADQHRATLDAVNRVRTLSASNPQAALEEAQRLLGLRLPPKASDNAQGDEADPDPQTTRLMSEMNALKAKLAEFDQFREQAVTSGVRQQIATAVREFPLYKNDPTQAARAENFVAAYLQANPQASIREVAGLVHADDVAFIQSQLQQTRDQRATTTEQLATIPPGSGSPAMSQLPGDLKMNPEELKRGDFRGALGRILGSAKKMAGG